MENSLIPRPFSPTDAKRRAEENAREAERRSSARNASSSTIGAGGKLDLAGDINVVDGGVVRVVGNGIDSYTGNPYEVTSEMTTYKNEGNYGIYQSPCLQFSSAIFGGAGSGARIYSRSGREVWVEGEDDSGYGSISVAGSFYAGYTSKDSSLAGDRRSATIAADDSQGIRALFTDTQAGTEAGLHVRRNGDPTATLHVGHFTWRDSLFARLRTKLGGKLWLESNSAAGSAAVVMDGAGNIDLQTTGKLTNNGAAIGGAGAVSSVAGKTGAVTLVKADVGLDKVDNTADVDKPISTKTQAALDLKAPLTSYHAEYTSTVTGAPTNAGTLNLAAEPQSSNAATICTVVGPGQIRVNVAGYYSIDWYGYHGGTEAGINSYMNIVSSHRAIRLSSIDIPSNSGSSALAIGSIYLPANAILTFNCNFGNSQPNFQSFITLHKKR